MQLSYDRGMLIVPHNEKYFIYSPANHVRVMVDEYASFLVEQILAAQGWIEYEKIIFAFADKFDVTLTTEEVMKQIERLVKMEVFFKTKEDLFRSRNKKIDKFKIIDKPPNLVYLLLTYKCNFQCSYCYLRDAYKDIRELDTEQWIQAIRRLKDVGIKKFCITGGEALVRDDIVEILQEIKTDDCEVDLLTNGSLLAEKFSELDPLIDHLVISLDSLDYDTQATTRSNYGYQKILNAIELYSKTNPQKLQVRAVINKHNLNQMNDFSQKLNRQYGIRTIRTLVNPISSEELDIIPEAVGKIAIDQDLLETFNYNMKYRKCGACNSVIALNPAGDVMPCQAIMKPEFRMTNIFEDGWFATYLQSEVRQQFISLNLDQMEKCNECSYRYLCGGVCPALAYNIYGKLDHHVPLFCDYLREKAHNTLLYAKGDWQDV